MEAGLDIRPQIADARHHQRKERRKELLQIISDEEIFLARFADHRSGIDCLATMEDCFDVENRIVMLQRVIAVVIPEWSLGSPFMRRRVTNQGKLGFSGETVSAEGILAQS